MLQPVQPAPTLRNPPQSVLTIHPLQNHPPSLPKHPPPPLPVVRARSDMDCEYSPPWSPPSPEYSASKPALHVRCPARPRPIDLSLCRVAASSIRPSHTSYDGLLQLACMAELSAAAWRRLAPAATPTAAPTLSIKCPSAIEAVHHASIASGSAARTRRFWVLLCRVVRLYPTRLPARAGA